MPRTKDTDYLQISARIRAMESRLLTRERRERMIEARSVNEALRVLNECGYRDAEDGDYEKVLAAERAEIFDDLYNASPTSELVDFFRIKYDYHNLKTLVKGEKLGLNVRDLLSDAGRADPKKITDAFELNDLRSLPQDMAAAAELARETLASTGDPQLCDLVLDKACYAQMDKTANLSGSSFLQGYFRAMTDSANLRTIVRIRKMNKGSELMRWALMEGGNVGYSSLLAHALTGEPMADVFSGSIFEQAALAEDGDLTRFERECDNALTAYLKTAGFVPFGDAVVVAYLASREAELTAVRIILAGKAAGISGDEIRERLRDSYV